MSGVRHKRWVSVGQKFEARALPLIAGEGEQPLSRQNFDLSAMMVTDGNLAKRRCDHTVRGNHHAVGTIEGDDDRHPLKTLFTFISG